MKIKHLLKYLFVCSLMLLCFEVQATSYYVNNNSDPEDVFCSVAGDDSFYGLSSDNNDYNNNCYTDNNFLVVGPEMHYLFFYIFHN